MNAITAVEKGFESGGVHALSGPLLGNKISIGNGFVAQSFRAQEVGELMDPLVMVDHYVMTEPTFGAHPHAGLSAVSLLFEDSHGLFRNRDSLGNDIDLCPGDLYWLRAGSGAVHDEYPRENARTHGLQVFVNVPQSQRDEAPASLLVRAKDMPVIKAAAYRVKVALGESNGVRGAISPSIPMTILDGVIESGGRFSQPSKANRGVWIQAIRSNLEVIIQGEVRSLSPGQSLAVRANEGTELSVGNPSGEQGQFVLFEGEPVGETYVQDGPFVMGSKDQIAAIKTAYKLGRLGRINERIERNTI